MARDRRRRAGRRVLVLALALAACDAPTLPEEQAPYSYTQLTGGQVYRWASGRTIAVFADTEAAPAEYDIVAATRRAAARWNAVPGYGDFTMVVVDDVRAADVVVRHFAAPRRVDVMDCDSPLGGAGETTFCPEPPVAPVLPLLDGAGGRVKVEVTIDVERVPNLILELAGQTRARYFETLVTHELGHVLGIGGHSTDAADIMRGVPQVGEPSADDRRTLRAVLRQAPDIRL